MKKKQIIAGVVLAILGIPFMDARAQGGLIPSGAPAPTMKTLDQVEARTLIPSAGYVINRPGSYYLVTNLNASGTTAGISVNASDVTLDLNGFTVSGAAAFGNGVFLAIGVQNVLIENGTIRDCSESGIVAGKTLGCTFRNLRVLNHSNAGISGGYNTVIKNCTVRDNGGYGIHGVSGSRIVGNIIEDNNVGLYLSGTGNYVENNMVKDNSDNYSFSTAGNQLNLLLCEVPETLDWPCSVKFAGTLTCSQADVNGITVNSDNVTIDMEGHALIGPGESSGHGIYQHNDYRNLTVVNGKVVHWENNGNGGLYLKGENGILEGIEAQKNGVYGIFVEQNWSLRACVAMENTGTGIYVHRNNTLENCSSKGNGASGIYAGEANVLQSCATHGNTNSGINAEDENTLMNCSARYNGMNGIRVMSGDNIQSCACQHNSSSGIYAWMRNNIQSCEVYYNGSGCSGYLGNNIQNCIAQCNNGDGFICGAGRVIACHAAWNGFDVGGDGAGIFVRDGGNSCIEGNNVISNTRGIEVEGGGNFIVRNTCAGNDINWVVAAGNVCLVVDAAITGSAISGDSGGTAPGSTDPNANYSY